MQASLKHKIGHGRKAPIPAPWPEPFIDGIQHPELWLWDSWIRRSGESLHLYCLALSRTALDGSPIFPEDRNDFTFHVREFISDNGGDTFRDKGVFFAPGTLGDADSRNVWSGHVCAENQVDFYYTGISQTTLDHPFVQTICHGRQVDGVWSAHVLSSPVQSYDDIRSAGYYLGPREALGHKDGEEGGPILCWRDPYLLRIPVGDRLFWSAKVGPKTPAIASAPLIETETGVTLGPLFPPIRLPDEHLMTQAEVPKIYPVEDGFMMLIAACDRLYEGQPDSEVSKLARLYKADMVSGPWKVANDKTSRLAGLDNLFGMSVLSVSPTDMTILGPYTEMAPEPLRLTFAPRRTIQFGTTPE